MEKDLKPREKEEILKKLTKTSQGVIVDPFENPHLRGISVDFKMVVEECHAPKCPCEVCKAAGVEVVIFRGNNRNRRRGFHNTYVFYRLFAESVMQAESVATTPLQTLLPLRALGGHAR